MKFDLKSSPRHIQRLDEYSQRDKRYKWDLCNY